jgi:hypothetical protein
MRLEPLYRVRLTYPYARSSQLAGPGGTESQYFFLAEGRCEGRISGQLRGANHPRRRTDHTFMPDFQGVIETDDGAIIMFDYFGYGRAYPEERRQIVSAATHLSDDPRYRWLNDVMCVGTGEVGDPELVVDMAELVWEPPTE